MDKPRRRVHAHMQTDAHSGATRRLRLSSPSPRLPIGPGKRARAACLRPCSKSIFYTLRLRPANQSAARKRLHHSWQQSCASAGAKAGDGERAGAGGGWSGGGLTLGFALEAPRTRSSLTPPDRPDTNPKVGPDPDSGLTFAPPERNHANHDSLTGPNRRRCLQTARSISSLAPLRQSVSPASSVPHLLRVCV